MQSNLLLTGLRGLTCDAIGQLLDHPLACCRAACCQGQWTEDWCQGDVLQTGLFSNRARNANSNCSVLAPVHCRL